MIQKPAFFPNSSGIFATFLDVLDVIILNNNHTSVDPKKEKHVP